MKRTGASSDSLADHFGVFVDQDAHDFGFVPCAVKIVVVLWYPVAKEHQSSTRPGKADAFGWWFFLAAAAGGLVAAGRELVGQISDFKSQIGDLLGGGDHFLGSVGQVIGSDHGQAAVGQHLFALFDFSPL